MKNQWLPVDVSLQMSLQTSLKGLVHPKIIKKNYLLTLMSIQICKKKFCGTQNKIFWRMLVNNVLVLNDFHWIFSKRERKYYGFGMSWEWVNEDGVFISGWTSPLNALLSVTQCLWFSSLSLRGNKKKGIKSSIGRLFGKKEKSRFDQPLSKDGQMTPPVIPGSMKQTRIHYMREESCLY